MGIRLLLFISGFVISTGVWGQNEVLKFRNFNIRDGLSQSTVQQIFQDQKGFLWFTTSDGLNRFDGEKFVVYKNDHTRTNSLSDSWILRILLEDSGHTLWLLTADRAINTLNLKTHEVRRFIPGETDSCVIKPFRIIYFVFEDSDSNIWISTDRDLLKYNRITNQMTRMEVPVPVPGMDNTVTRVFQDSDHKLWFICMKGLFSFDQPHQRFIPYCSGKNAKVTSDTIFQLIEDKNKNLWMLSSKGFSRYDRSSDKFIPYLFDNQALSLGGAYVNRLIRDKDHSLWAGTNHGLIRFSLQNFKYAVFRKSSKPGSLVDDNVLDLRVDSSGRLWIGTAGGLNSLTPGSSLFRHYPQFPVEPANAINQVILLRNGEIFTLSGLEETKGGYLSRLNPQTGKLETITHDNCNPLSIPSTFVFRPFTDRDGNLWLGTFGNGIIEYPINGRKFEHILFKTRGVSAGSNSVWAFSEDSKGFIWVALYDQGFARFNPSGKSFEVFRPEIKIGNVPSNYTVMNIVIDRNDNAWLSTAGAGLIKYNIHTGSYKNYRVEKGNKQGISSNYIRMIMPDLDGKLWIAYMDNGIDIFDPAVESFTHLRHQPGNPNSLSNDHVWYITRDHHNYIWISSDGFIDRYDPADSVFTHYRSKSSPANGILADRALCILPASDGNIWFGTSGGGLSRFNPTTGNFRHWTESDGLSNNVVYGLLEDADHHLWLSTNNGLSVFTPRTGKFRNYSESDGLQSNEFNSGAFFQSSNHQFYFGGINGFNVFDPLKIVNDSITPETVITGFQLFNKTLQVVPPGFTPPAGSDQSGKLIYLDDTYYLPGDISYMKGITLQYNEKMFSIEFASLQYESPGKNRFRYKMENFDEDWNYSEDRNYATYTNLPSGKYIFKVAAANSDGIFNPKPAILFITIVPPFWKTWWFIGFVLIVVIALIWLFIYMREQNLKNAKSRLEAKVRERTHEIEEKNEELELRNVQILKQKEEIAYQARQLQVELVNQNRESEIALLRSQVNPHFLFNTLNNIYSLVYQKSEDAPAAIMKLSEIMRYMLYEANNDKVPLGNEINYLKSFIELQLLRINNKDFVEFSITGDIYGKSLAPMLLIPFVENAFKHGIKQGRIPGIIINLAVRGQLIYFDVTNYHQKGESVNKDQTGGIGMKNIRRRLELLHPQSHHLTVTDSGDTFHVALEINLG